MQHRVFVVEDHEFLRSCYIQLLDREDGLELCGAVATAEEALRILSLEPCDVLVTDISLPGMNGYELVRKLRQRRALGSTRVIMVTGHDDVGYRNRAIHVGVDAFVVKGDVFMLLETIRQVLALAGEAPEA